MVDHKASRKNSMVSCDHAVKEKPSEAVGNMSVV